MRIALAAALAAAFSLASVPVASTTAEACHRCKPASKTIVKTNYRVRTVQQVRNVTRYRDVTQVRHVRQVRNVVRDNYVNVVHRTVDVTRVQPVTHVNIVTRVRPVTKLHVETRVHHRTVYQHSRETVGQTVYVGGRTVHSHRTVMLPANLLTRGSVVHVRGGSRHIDCNCR
ncbi:MAG: hypothetical protein JNM89_04970 [Hyphomicrobiaceae bacterium]|nr:hypothetical protein [Hyphomicrobiaceae bacterium]